MPIDEKVLAIGALAVALAAIGVVLRTLWRMMRGLFAFAVDSRNVIMELTREQAGEPNVFIAFRTLIADVGAIKAQVMPNGGTSDTVADRVHRIERALSDHIGLPAAEAHARGGS